MKTPIVNANSKLLVPGLPGHQAPVKGATQGSEKRKTETKEVSELVILMLLFFFFIRTVLFLDIFK